jgi:hypothetical protein
MVFLPLVALRILSAWGEVHATIVAGAVVNAGEAVGLDEPEPADLGCNCESQEGEEEEEECFLEPTAPPAPSSPSPTPSFTPGCVFTTGGGGLGGDRITLGGPRPFKALW